VRKQREFDVEKRAFAEAADYGGHAVSGVDIAAGLRTVVAVDDVDARVKKATAAGATLMRPLFDIPGIGRIAILRQPGGAGVGWMTPATA